MLLGLGMLGSSGREGERTQLKGEPTPLRSCGCGSRLDYPGKDSGAKSPDTAAGRGS